MHLITGLEGNSFSVRDRSLEAPPQKFENGVSFIMRSITLELKHSLNIFSWKGNFVVIISSPREFPMKVLS